jgi:hypothetical protein
MLKFLRLLTCCLFWNTLPAQKPAERLQHLIEKAAFTKASRFLQDSSAVLSAQEKNFYQAIVSNAFNDPATSNQLLGKVATGKDGILVNDKLQKLYYATQYDNYIKLFHYEKAYSTGTYLLNRFKAMYTPEAWKEEQQALKIWELLRHSPAQQVTRQGDTRLELTKDMAGLMNIPVNVDDSTYTFIFDTGAGMCTITSSYASKLHFNILPGSEVSIKSGITGIPTRVKLAIAPRLRLGNITVTNSVFLVFPDSALSFAEGRYKINAIIGFPIVKELGEMVFEQNSLSIAEKEAYAPEHKNLAVDELTPVLFLNYQHQSLPFTFDTGAGTSVFSDIFYETYRQQLDSMGTSKDVQFGGAGGSKQFNGISIPELTLQNENHDITFKNVFVSKEPFTITDKYYGNLGQDLIRQFKKMILNFSKSYLLFEN